MKRVIQIDDVTYKLLKASPEAVALRTRAIEWKDASDKDNLDHPPGCKHERAAEVAHRRFFNAALQFAEAVRQRGSEYMHLMARTNEIVQFLPISKKAKDWAREHAVDGKAILVSFWCETLTVKSPSDRRFIGTFGPREATWSQIEDEAEKVRYAIAIGLPDVDPVPHKPIPHPRKRARR